MNSRLKRIKSLETGCEAFSSFFDEDELSFLISSMRESFSDESTLHRRYPAKGKTSDVMSSPVGEVKARVHDFLRTKLAFILPQEATLDFTFHHNFKPYWLHTDAGYDEKEVFFKQGIIPLEVTPVGSEVYTMIMDQRYYGSSGFDGSEVDVEGLVDSGLTETEIKEYWEGTEFQLKTLRRFTINTPFQWKLGDTAIWDRSMIHGSSDFSNSGTKSKIGLMWISKLD